jgi:hypothetical protein
MTTITLIKQLKNWLNGTLVPTRVERKPNPSDLLVEPAIAVTQQPAAPQAKHQSVSQLACANALQQYHQALQNTYTPVYQGLLHELPDRFASYKEKIMPKLREQGYLYFRSASSTDYLMHEEWCHEHCDSPTLPHCDVWPFDAQYPRAFKNETDAMMFALTFDTIKIDANK